MITPTHRIELEAFLPEELFNETWPEGLYVRCADHLGPDGDPVLEIVGLRDDVRDFAVHHWGGNDAGEIVRLLTLIEELR